MRRKKCFQSLFILSLFITTITIVQCNLNAKLSLQTTKQTKPYLLGFSEEVLLSTKDQFFTHHVEPTLAISEKNELFVGWKEALGHNTGGLEVSFTKSLDYGRTWAEPEYMSEGLTSIGQSDPWLVYQNGMLYYSYLYYNTQSPTLTGDIMVARSSDKGDTWSYEFATEAKGFADKETMTVGGDGTIYVTYDDVTYENLTVRVSKSIDGGENFVETSIIADSINQPFDHLGPYITTDSSNNVIVAWVWFTSGAWGDVYVTKSIDAGQNFGNRIDVNALSENATFETSPEGAPAKATLPVVRFDSNDRMYILWAEVSSEATLWDIFLRYSDNFGITWSQKYSIAHTTDGNQWQPDLDIDSQNHLHVSYYHEDEFGYRPFYRFIREVNETSKDLIMDGAIAITTINTSSYFTRPGDYFTIRVDSRDVPHIVWTDGRDAEMDIYYSHGILNDNPVLPYYAKVLVIVLPTTTAVVLVGIFIVIIIKKRKKS